MNFRELGIRITDLTLGRKINGTVAAVMLDEVSPDEVKFTRYIVETEQGLFDIKFVKNSGGNFGLTPAFHKETPQFSLGENISTRALNIKPWINGGS